MEIPDITKPKMQKLKIEYQCRWKMNYHGIETDSMLNGSGLRVCLWCSGCEHHCSSCQNPQTWDIKSGIEFDDAAREELFRELSADYISGLTLTGGDPLHPSNLETVLGICKEVKQSLPQKSIWIYTGYSWEDIWRNADEITEKRKEIVKLSDVIVEGKFDEKLLDVNYPWAGSLNQRVIDIQESICKNRIVLWSTYGNREI